MEWSRSRACSPAQLAAAPGTVRLFTSRGNRASLQGLQLPLQSSSRRAEYSQAGAARQLVARPPVSASAVRALWPCDLPGRLAVCRIFFSNLSRKRFSQIDLYQNELRLWTQEVGAIARGAESAICEMALHHRQVLCHVTPHAFLCLSVFWPYTLELSPRRISIY